MPVVNGIGAVMIYAENPEGLAKWYRENLGVATTLNRSDGCYYGDIEDDDGKLVVHFGIYPRKTAKTTHSGTVMVNYRASRFEELLGALRESGVTLLGEPQVEPCGSFAYVVDPEGNPIEIWSGS